LSVTAEALHLPDQLTVPIDGLPAGSQITAASVTLPEGTELAADPDLVIAIVTAAATAEEMEAELGEAPAAEEAPAGEESGEAQPAEAAGSPVGSDA
jgi:large subunit ribosomal protein L25